MQVYVILKSLVTPVVCLHAGVRDLEKPPNACGVSACRYI